MVSICVWGTSLVRFVASYGPALFMLQRVLVFAHCPCGSTPSVKEELSPQHLVS